MSPRIKWKYSEKKYIFTTDLVILYQIPSEVKYWKQVNKFRADLDSLLKDSKIKIIFERLFFTSHQDWIGMSAGLTAEAPRGFWNIVFRSRLHVSIPSANAWIEVAKVSLIFGSRTLIYHCFEKSSERTLIPAPSILYIIET